ncbi:MAG: DUF3800 domain-containing protein [Bacteroidota bacterium]
MKLFQATAPAVAERRNQMAEDMRVSYVPQSVEAPSIFVYADESGKNDDHLVVGSAWMIATGEYPKFQAETEEWKRTNGVKYELHSSSLGKSRVLAYKEFIERFVIQQGIIGFKAVSIPNSGFSDTGAVFADLFYTLLRRGVEHEHSTGRAPLPRHVTFTKDFEAAGPDERLTMTLQREMNRDAKTEFGGKLSFYAEPPFDSKAEILIQIADLFTWCVNRKLNVTPDDPQEWNWKDDFAHWVLDSVGFVLDETETVKDQAVRLSLRSPNLSRATIPRYVTPPSELRFDVEEEARESEKADDEL